MFSSTLRSPAGPRLAVTGSIPWAAPIRLPTTELPRVYWPSTTWFVDADICHRFRFQSIDFADGVFVSNDHADGITIRINGTAYVGNELRVLAPTGGVPVQGFTGLHV